MVAINGSFTDTLPHVGDCNWWCGDSRCNQYLRRDGYCGCGIGTSACRQQSSPIGVCTISVNITGTVDNNYINSVQILSTDAGNGNTSSANITVINPPHIVKAFGAATIPLNGTTSLTFTLDSNTTRT